MDRRSSTSTLATPDSLIHAPRELLSVCRSVGLLNRSRGNDPDIAQAIRLFGTSIKLWPRVVLPLNQMVEKSQALSDVSTCGSQVQDWLFELSLSVDLEDPEFPSIQDL